MYVDKDMVGIQANVLELVFLQIIISLADLTDNQAYLLFFFHYLAPS